MEDAGHHDPDTQCYPGCTGSIFEYMPALAGRDDVQAAIRKEFGDRTPDVLSWLREADIPSEHEDDVLTCLNDHVRDEMTTVGRFDAKGGYGDFTVAVCGYASMYLVQAMEFDDSGWMESFTEAMAYARDQYDGFITPYNEEEPSGKVSAVVWLHGFGIGEDASLAAAIEAEFEDVRVIALNLGPDPDQVACHVGMILADLRAVGIQRIALAGKALGAFHAWCLAVRHGVRALLVDPDLRPDRNKRKHVTSSRNKRTPDALRWKPQHLAMLEALRLQAGDAPDPDKVDMFASAAFAARRKPKAIRDAMARCGCALSGDHDAVRPFLKRVGELRTL